MKTSSSGISNVFEKIFNGKTIFQNHYIAKDNGTIAFASSFLSNIKTIDIKSDKNIDEDFIMAKISGKGIIF